MLRSILPIVGADPALAQALSQTGNRDIAMPRGLVPPALALLAGAGAAAGGAAAGPGAPGGAEAEAGEGDSAAHSGPGGEQARPLAVAVTATGRGAEELAAALGSYLPGEAVDVFPAWETLPHERLSPRSDTVARRLRVQRRLAHPAEFPPLRILAMPVRALLQPIAAGLGDLAPVRVRLGDAVDLEALERDLAGAAYSRVDMVERRGEFAVRGGILDVFPPTDPRPSRIELFGDEVEEIRTFSVADQRSLEPVGEVYAPPCREILVDERVRARARGLVKDLPGAVDMLDRIAAGSAPEGMESLAPALVDMVPVLDTLPADARIALVEPERVAQRAD